MKHISYYESQPELLAYTRFFSTPMTRNSEQMKNQYVYRLMIFLYGRATIVLSDGEQTLDRGDVVYFTPDTPYRILNTDGDFGVLNLFFDFEHRERESRFYSSVTLFERAFDVNQCLERYCFDDLSVFNESKIFCQCNLALDLSKKLFAAKSEHMRQLILPCILQALAECRDTAQTRGKHRAVLDYIDENAASPLTADTIAEVFHYHKNYVNRMVKAATGMTLKRYVLEAKIRLADKLMTETDMNGTELAAYLGFYDLSHFIKTYRQIKRDNEQNKERL